MTDSTHFAEPWEARAFAMVRTLRDGGVVSAQEWSDALAAQLDDDAAQVQYRHWLAALEHVLTAKGVVSPAELLQYRTAWIHAAERTPHGQPIDLTANDFHL